MLQDFRIRGDTPKKYQSLVVTPNQGDQDGNKINHNSDIIYIASDQDHTSY